MDEIKNVKLAGGLNLPCLASMADSLLASQCIRMIRCGDMKSLGHMDFWLGDLLVGIVPWMGQGVRAVDTPEYFGHLGQVLANLMIGDTLTTTSVKTLTNRIVYADMTSSFPPPKVVRESDQNVRPQKSADEKEQNTHTRENRDRDPKFYFDKDLSPNMNLGSDEKKYEEWRRKMVEYMITGEPKLDMILREGIISEKEKLEMAEMMSASLSVFESWNSRIYGLLNRYTEGAILGCQGCYVSRSL